MSTEHTIKHTQLYKKIPTLLTLGNSLCGFTAILLALQAYEKILTKNSNDHFEIISHNANTTIMPYVFAACAWVIIGAMIFDALDGWSARKLNATSLHGIEMDSLADMVTFGVAPAVLVYIYAHVTVFLGFAEVKDLGFIRQDRLFWLAGAMYMGCAALRLALYNAMEMESKFNPKEGAAKDTGFRGIPTPGAASAVCSIVIMGTTEANLPDWLMTFFLPIYTGFLGLLMISPIPYPHMAKWLVSPVNRARKIIILLLIIVVGTAEIIKYGSGPKMTAAALINLYVLSGPIMLILSKIKGHKITEDEDLISA